MCLFMLIKQKYSLQIFNVHIFQHLIERSWYAVTETCLAFTVFRDDFSPRFVALFTLLLFLKCFHWLAEDRIDYVSSVYSIFDHMQMASFTVENVFCSLSWLEWLCDIFSSVFLF